MIPLTELALPRLENKSYSSSKKADRRRYLSLEWRLAIRLLLVLPLLPWRRLWRGFADVETVRKHFTSKSPFFRSIGRAGSNFLSNLCGALCDGDTVTSSRLPKVLVRRTSDGEQREATRSDSPSAEYRSFTAGLRKYFNTLRSIVSCYYLY